MKNKTNALQIASALGIVAALLASTCKPEQIDGRPDARGQANATPAKRSRFDGFKKPADSDLRNKLTPMQYDVTQNSGTEPPFRNAYWDNHSAGIYVDIVSGEPLFSSTDKFDSGTGWPSFTKALETANVVENTDGSHGMERTEVRSRHANSHLGHLFDDGPKPTGLRYCINSASLRFIPASELAKQGYESYLGLFGLK